MKITVRARLIYHFFAAIAVDVLLVIAWRERKLGILPNNTPVGQCPPAKRSIELAERERGAMMGYPERDHTCTSHV